MKLFIISALLFFNTLSLGNNFFVKHMNRALANSDVQEVKYLLNEHGPLGMNEESHFRQLAQAAIERIRDHLEEPSKITYDLVLSSVVLSLSTYLAYIQIMRLGYLEDVLPCRIYALATGFLIVAAAGATIGFIKFLNAVENLLNRTHLDEGQLEEALKEARAILALISKSR